jgi:hypothetical protein
MLGDLLGFAQQAVAQNLPWAAAAALLLGVLAVWLSPCHLVGVSLAAAYLQRDACAPGDRILRMALFVGTVLLATAGVAGLTLALGRLAGDTGLLGIGIAATALLVAGLMLLDAFPLPSLPAPDTVGRAPGGLTAVVLGVAFALATGPCSLAFIAPLAVLPTDSVDSGSGTVVARSLLFVVGHALGLLAVLAGGRAVERLLSRPRRSALIDRLRRAGGAVPVFTAGYVATGAIA